MYFYYRNIQGSIVISNLPDYILESASLNISKETRYFCRVSNKFRREVVEINDKGTFFLAIEGEEVTSTNLRRYFKVYKELASHVDPQKINGNMLANQRVRRLKHNIETYNANILQEIYRLVPQDSLTKGAQNQRNIINEVIREKSLDAASAVLRILKNSTLMKSEFSVHDLITSKNPLIQKKKHSLHKVVTLSLNSFWLELMEKNIQITIQPFTNSHWLDYTSISVALCHLFDNATKYSCPGTRLEIYFEENDFSYSIFIKMVSLRISQIDLREMFKEGYSGNMTNKLGLSGSGIGMFLVKKIMHLNGGSIRVSTNTDLTKSVCEKGVDFEENLFELNFSKSF